VLVGRVEAGLAGVSPLRVLDLFAGLGGLSIGFCQAGFSITGVDIDPSVAEIFSLNGTGKVVVADLATETVFEDVPVLIGGPPCRPWSSINVSRRGDKHGDAPLLDRFFVHVLEIRPEFVLMENVPLLAWDRRYLQWLRRLRRNGYSLSSTVVCYAEYGAPTSRRRLITVATRRRSVGSARVFFKKLEAWRRPASCVREAIFWLRNTPKGGYPDHVWPDFRTIARYSDYYQSGKFGWTRLDYSKPAPSFGNIMKTYILHPEAGQNGPPLRVISIREALCVMGFSRWFRFPEGMSLRKRYQMVADTVSPVFAVACAQVVRELLFGGR
jgi:DNA (cytosine-5)-methyltransferase 1